MLHSTYPTKFPASRAAEASGLSSVVRDVSRVDDVPWAAGHEHSKPDRLCFKFWTDRFSAVSPGLTLTSELRVRQPFTPWLRSLPKCRAAASE